MPIDADAYMSGAIPTLSRGGSWVPYDATGARAANSTGGGTPFGGGTRQMGGVGWGDPSAVGCLARNGIAGTGGAPALQSRAAMPGRNPTGHDPAAGVSWAAYDTDGARIVSDEGPAPFGGNSKQTGGLGWTDPSTAECMARNGISGAGNATAFRMAAAGPERQIDSGNLPSAMFPGHGYGGSRHTMQDVWDARGGFGPRYMSGGFGGYGRGMWMGGPHYPMHHGVVPAGPDVIQHPGWLAPKPTVPLQPAQNSVTSDTASTRRNGTPGHPVSSACQSSLANPLRVASNVGTSETIARVRSGSMHWQGGSWEKGGGAPKPITREAEYGRKTEETRRDANEKPGARSEKKSTRPPVPHRKRADSLPAPPSLEPYSSLTEVIQSSDHKSRTGSSRAAGSNAGRPRIVKHTQDVSVPSGHASSSLIKAKLSVCGGSAGSSPYRKLALPSPQHPRPRPLLRTTPLSTIFTATSSIDSSSGSESITAFSPPVPREATELPRRPRPERRHSDEGSPGPPRPPPDPGRTKRVRHSSSPNLDWTASTSSAGTHVTPKPKYVAILASRADRSAVSSVDQTIDPRASAVPLDMKSLAFALAPESAAGSASKVRRREDAGQGYIAPLADDAYDRYTAHPAAPTPPRADRQVNTLPLNPEIHHQVSPTGVFSRVPSSPSGGAASETRSLTRDTVISETARSKSGQREYTPLSYPPPLRDLRWNREGPAMRTHGVAWLRQDQVGENGLSEAPAGPRWEVARPPRGEIVTGRNGWWESGGNA